MRRLGLSGAVAVLATAATLVGWSAIDAAAAPDPASATQIVSYQGLTFTVPKSWPVVAVSASSTTCVRFDQHAVYLGTPGANQNCPAGLVGRTEALLIQPAAGTASTDTDDTADHQLTATAPGVQITATYGQDEPLVQQILASAALPAPSAPKATPQALRPFASSTVLSMDYTGPGFDACSAPSSATMSTWLASSPYRAIGIYIGGSDRTCTQPNLTASWVAQQVAAGWHFQPLYVGPQALKGELTSPASQAVTAADDAVAQAKSLGFGPGSLLYYDMEAYPATQSAAAVAFMAAWTTELHADGYSSGIYGSTGSGISDLVSNYTTVTMPDVVDFAHWNNTASTDDAAIPTNEWANHQRAHQYTGGADETNGGVTINIDHDYLDVEPECNGPTGSVLARTDIGYCGWIPEADPRVGAIAVGSDSTQMIIAGDGAAYAKNSVGLYGWTQESDPGVKAISTNDGVQLIIASDGAVYAKNSIGLYGWTQESDPGVRAVAVGSDGTQMIIASNGAVYAKNGIGLYGWTQESDPGVKAIATSAGNQLIIAGDGAVYAKNSIGLYGWTQESDPGVKAIAVGGDAQMIIAGDGAAYAKSSIGLYGWTQESDPGVKAIATSAGNQLIIAGDGAAYAKNLIGLYGWTKESDPPVQAIAVGSDGTQLIVAG